MTPLVSRFAALTLGIALATESVRAQSGAGLPRPIAPEAKPFVMPAFVVDTLANGLRFAVLENHEVPIVVIRIPVPGMGPAGTSYLDPVAKNGAWGMLMAMLREGTTTRSAADIRDAFDNLGAATAEPAAPNFFPFGTGASRSAWQQSIELYADMLMHPAIPADAFSRLRDSYLSTTYGKPSAGRQATVAAMRAIFGTDQPYTRFPTAETIRNISRDDLIAMQATYLRPQNFLIVIGGDVTRAEARKVLTQAFAGWQRGGQAVVAPVIGLPAQLPPTSIYLVDSPGASQVSITSVQGMPGRETPDGPALQLVMHALGENTGLAGRMSRAFRGERGLSYSANIASVWRPVGQPALMQTVTLVASGNADTAVTQLVRVLREVKGDKPITDAEFATSRSFAIGKQPVSMESITDATQTAVLGVLRDGLPPSFYNDWIKRMSALTAADVRAAASKFIDPDHTAIAVVGDRSKIEAALRATGIPVVIVDR